MLSPDARRVVPQRNTEDSDEDPKGGLDQRPYCPIDYDKNKLSISMSTCAHTSSEPQLHHHQLLQTHGAAPVVKQCPQENRY